MQAIRDEVNKEKERAVSAKMAEIAALQIEKSKAEETLKIFETNRKVSMCVNTYIYIYIYIYIYMGAHVCIYTYIYINIYMYIHIYVYIYLYVYICVYIPIYISMYTYIPEGTS